ncbi:MAG: hypothetical protein IT374_19975 [Polyangiaceae bacterium]|nr:hypothetical protein [Polyangiaceae bacterium]
MRGAALSRGLGVALAVGVVAGDARADDEWLGRDKRLHFGASAVVAAGGYGAASVWTTSRGARALAGGGLALAVGAAKEGWDAAGRGDPSWRDLAWDAAGAAVGVAVAWAIDLALRPAARAHADAPLVVRW